MLRTGKLILMGDYDTHMLYHPRTEEEKKAMSKSFSWSGKDYRQNLVNKENSDAVASPEDFLPFYFRHLSATIVGAGSWKATEFSEAVLRKAQKLLQYKPAYVNHELEVGNIVGVNGDIKFVGTSTDASGTKIPGGLEGPIWIDSKLHTDLCRKLTAYPVPHIQSVSVTVSYNWEPSHTFTDRSGDEDEWEFEYRIGTMVDGKMVRRVVTEIIDFYETSLVYLGADPYAKILDENGKPFNIEKSAIVGTEQFKSDPLAELYKKGNIMYVKEDSLKKENVIHLRKGIQEGFSKMGKSNNFNNDTNKNQMKEIVKLIAESLGKSEDEITPELMANYTVVKKDELTSLKAEKDSRVKAEGERDEAKTSLSKFEKICKVEDLVELEKEVELEKVTEFAKTGSSILKAKREEVVRLYKAQAGDNADNAIIETLEKSEGQALDAFLKQYGSSLVEQFKPICKDCNSENVQYKKSESEGNGDDEKNNDDEREPMAYRLRD